MISSFILFSANIANAQSKFLLRNGTSCPAYCEVTATNSASIDIAFSNTVNPNGGYWVVELPEGYEPCFVKTDFGPDGTSDFGSFNPLSSFCSGATWENDQSGCFTDFDGWYGPNGDWWSFGFY